MQGVGDIDLGGRKRPHIDLRRFQSQRQVRPALPAPVCFPRHRRSQDVADDIAGNRPAGGNGELGVQAKGAVALAVGGRGRPGGHPTDRPQQAGAAYVDAAVELGGVGRARHRPLQFGAAAAGHADPQLLDLEPIPLACDGEADTADRLAAEVGLVDGQGEARAAVGRQDVAHPQRQWNDAFARPRAFPGAGKPIEVEPTRGKVHLELEAVLPACLGLANDELGSAGLFERQRQVAEATAGKIGFELGLEIERQRLRAVVLLRAGGRLTPRLRPWQARQRQPGGELAVELRFGHQVQQAGIDQVAGAGLQQANGRAEADPRFRIGLGRGYSDFAFLAAFTEAAAKAIGSIDGWSRQLPVDAFEPQALGPAWAVHGQHPIGDLQRGQGDVGRKIGGVGEDLPEALPVPASPIIACQP